MKRTHLPFPLRWFGVGFERKRKVYSNEYLGFIAIVTVTYILFKIVFNYIILN